MRLLHYRVEGKRWEGIWPEVVSVYRRPAGYYEVVLHMLGQCRQVSFEFWSPVRALAWLASQEYKCGAIRLVGYWEVR